MSKSVEQNRIQLAWVFGVLALIYNPVVRVHLNREIWSALNIATVAILVLSMLRDSRIIASSSASSAAWEAVRWIALFPMCAFGGIVVWVIAQFVCRFQLYMIAAYNDIERPRIEGAPLGYFALTIAPSFMVGAAIAALPAAIAPRFRRVAVCVAAALSTVGLALFFSRNAQVERLSPTTVFIGLIWGTGWGFKAATELDCRESQVGQVPPAAPNGEAPE